MSMVTVGALAPAPVVRRQAQAPGPVAPLPPAKVHPDAPPARKLDLLDGARSFFAGAFGFLRHLVKPSGVWHNPAAPTPPDRGGLKVVSYNIYVKGQNLDGIARDLQGLDGDVVCLQEASEASARALARRLGMHVAWHENPLHSYGGNAILSRYPIEKAENVNLVNPWKDRLGEFWRKLREGGPRLGTLDSRHMLHATIKVGDRTVDVLDGHLTLFGNQTNARQIDQIAGLTERLAAQGHTVVAAGDWNANFAIAPGAPGVADGKGMIATPTDTKAEYADRYGAGAGNMGFAANQAAAARLQRGMTGFWEAPSRTVRVLGQTLTLEQALAALRAEPAGTRRHEALRLAVDGITCLGGRKRFDNIFASRDVRVEASHIDQTTRASDHQPVSTELTWR